MRIRDGHYAVVIGARSAIFAPQPDLGLIVIDEEHEWTYKQEEPAPRYHARAAAEKLAELTGAALVLGSATPDLESYHRARAGRYRLLALPERVQPSGEERRSRLRPSRPLPEVEVVDLRRELKEGNRGIFSRSLGRAVAEALAAGEQVILFLNRRGAASFVQCRDCGHVPACSRLRCLPHLPRRGVSAWSAITATAAAACRNAARSAGARASASLGSGRRRWRRRPAAPSPALACCAGTAT